MIARGVVRVVAGDQQTAYAVAGSLRPAHAVTMHAVLLLPALAWLMIRAGRPEPVRLRVIRTATLVYAAAAVLVTAASLAGFTLVPPATAAMVTAGVVTAPALAALALGVVTKPGP